MSDSLIEQVRKLIVAGSRDWSEYDKVFYGADFKALLAHMQAQQAVCDAARARRGRSAHLARQTSTVSTPTIGSRRVTPSTPRSKR